MSDLGSTTPNGDDRRGFLDRFGDWLIGKSGREADSTLSQVSYVMRLQFWPIFFTVLWIVICCVPDQLVEYYSAVVQSARASNPLARAGLGSLVVSAWWVSWTICGSALALAVLPGPMHLGATRKTAGKLSLLLPFALLVASFLAVPMGMLQPRVWRTLETDDYRIFGLVLLGHLAVGMLTGVVAMVALRRGRLASGAFAIVGWLRVSEVVALSWSDVLARDKGQVQLSVLGKGGVVRQVLLPETVSRSLLSLRGDAGNNDPVFVSRKDKGGGRLTARAVLGTIKRIAAAAGIEAPISPHWLRHAHGSHAIDRGATLPEVQATLGHANVATTSGYLHARPESSSGLKLDPGVFLR